MELRLDTQHLTEEDKGILLTLSGATPFGRSEETQKLQEELEVYDKNLTKAKAEIKKLKEEIKELIGKPIDTPSSGIKPMEELIKEVPKEVDEPVVTETKEEKIEPKEVVNEVVLPEKEEVVEESYEFKSVAEVGAFVQNYMVENHLLPTDIPQLTVTKLNEIYEALKGLSATKQEVLTMIGIK